MARAKTPVSEYKPLMLRLPKDVLEDTTALAYQSHRSMNAQIVYVLEEWLKQEKRKAHDDTPHPTPVGAGT